MRKYFENVMEFLQLVVLLAVVASCNMINIKSMWKKA